MARPREDLVPRPTFSGTWPPVTRSISEELKHRRVPAEDRAQLAELVCRDVQRLIVVFEGRADAIETRGRGDGAKPGPVPHVVQKRPPHRRGEMNAHSRPQEPRAASLLEASRISVGYLLGDGERGTPDVSGRRRPLPWRIAKSGGGCPDDLRGRPWFSSALRVRFGQAVHQHAGPAGSTSFPAWLRS